MVAIYVGASNHSRISQLVQDGVRPSRVAPYILRRPVAGFLPPRWNFETPPRRARRFPHRVKPTLSIRKPPGSPPFFVLKEKNWTWESYRSLGWSCLRLPAGLPQKTRLFEWDLRFYRAFGSSDTRNLKPEIRISRGNDPW